MLMFSFFKTLVGETVTVELKNNMLIRGRLISVDQYLNYKLDDITVVNGERYPQLIACTMLFIRGNQVRYVHLPPDKVDVQLLQDASRREHEASSKAANS